MPPSRSHIRSTIEAYLARHPGERAGLGTLLAALGRPADPTSRTTLPGHITCSALVIDDTDRVLHIHHRADGKVLTPSGHNEPGDNTLAAAALRALHEEAGIPPGAVVPWPGLRGLPLDIGVHKIDADPPTSTPAHHHYDLRFCFRLRHVDAAIALQAEAVCEREWRPIDRVAAPTLRDKLLKLGTAAPAGEPVNASALIYNDQGQYLLHLRDHLPGVIWEPGAWSLLGGGREPRDRTLEETVRRELREEAGLHIPVLRPFAVEEARGSDGATIPIAVYAGRWNGNPADLTLTEGVMLHWFAPDLLPRLRISSSTCDLVYRHAASGPEGDHEAVRCDTPREAEPPGSCRPPASPPSAAPSGTVLNVVGVHLYLENADGRVLLGLRHPDSAYAASMYHFLAGHCEQESALACLVREAREEAGLRIEADDVELAHVVHLVDTPGDRPRMQLVFRARHWEGTPEVREPDKCTSWGFWHPDELPVQTVAYTRAAIEGIRAQRLYTEMGWA
ncbi:NUDIX hydrolase [Streptomyces malaysiensis]|uniref:Nudix hydrolase domain-containing protein n=1 Tax=Streptomyces malaysiensis TaxID=92644 RepID=A0A7X5X2U5_STRMQ|nr:NUDIX domain-containing protein [Streptomyces malaysiensis]NIY65523.1 hypothetical protein [Streptomyces malaysiensis]